MKLIKNIGFCLCLYTGSLGHAQQGEFSLGFQAGTGLAWISTNTLAVRSVGSNLTAQIGATGAFGISEHLAVTSGLGLEFNRGGSLRHATGGNFFPESRLSDDALNSGQKPLPDGTRLKYSTQYVVVPIGLRWHSGEIGPGRIYVEAPVLSWGIAIQRRGAISAGEVQTNKENIARDVALVKLSWGVGGGVEYPLNAETWLTAGLHFSGGLNDITSDRAHTAVHNPDDNPFDPNDDYLEYSERSRALIHALVLRLGIVF